jgi:cobyrinic acid a,c-diamide synthase
LSKGRVLLAGTGSGCGKTTITCSILYELLRRNMNIVSFKCGPDYIDPMFHRNIIGMGSYNLDSFFLEPQSLKALFKSKLKTADYAIIEGVMGFYDGADYTTKGSSYEIAQITDTPVILIIDGKGCANSIEAIIKGYSTLREDSRIRGVILNRVSGKTYDYMQPVIRKYGLIPCGYVGKLKEELILPNRHLGLDYDRKADEMKMTLKNVAESVCSTLDLGAIISLAESADELEAPDCLNPMCCHEKVRIAMAKDEAFSFIYQENLDILEQLGADIITFSPVHDARLPEDVDGILLYGGYPEKYAEELSQNITMKKDIAEHIKNGIPTIAECGGYIYLKENLITDNNSKYVMCGILEGTAQNQKKLVRFGYATLEAKEDNWLLKKGQTIKAHEFHYWDCEENGNSFTALKTNGEKYDCIYAADNLFAGFLHIYYPANTEIAENFVAACRRYRRKK